jgi:integrase
MPVYQRGAGYQVVVSFKGNRWRRQFSEKSDALAWEAQARADLLAGRTPSLGGTTTDSASGLPSTLGELIEYTATHEWQDRKTGAGLAANARMIGSILGTARPIGDIKAHDIDGAIMSLQHRGNTNGTINRKLAALSKCLRTALHLEIVVKIPRIKKLREATHRTRWYTDDELDRMIQFCRDEGNDHFGLLIRFLADTGLRSGEASSLEWQDIQGDHVILTKTKSGQPRGVPLTRAAKWALEQRQGESSYGPWICVPLNVYWSKIRRHMGWVDDKQAVVHALRHTYISRLIQRGASLTVVKELAGHSNIETTMRYAHLAPHNLVDAVDLLNP